jgi:hypothetical protein
MWAYIISGIALVVAIMALPTVLQMFFGKPKVEIGLGIDHFENRVILECKIWNTPVTNKFLKIMHVKRMPIDDLTAFFKIRKEDTDLVLLPGYFPKIRNFSGISAQRIRLPASPMHASLGVVYKRLKGPAKLFEEGPKANKANLDVGRYIASITVIADGDGITKEGIFEVSEEAPFLRWVD